MIAWQYAKYIAGKNEKHKLGKWCGGFVYRNRVDAEIRSLIREIDIFCEGFEGKESLKKQIREKEIQKIELWEQELWKAWEDVEQAVKDHRDKVKKGKVRITLDDEKAVYGRYADMMTKYNCGECLGSPF